MELLFLTLADAAQVINGKLYMLGGGWDTLTISPQQQAGSHVTIVAMSLSVGWAEMAKEHDFVFELRQSGQRVGQIGSGKFTVRKPDGDAFLKHRTFMLAMPVEVSLTQGEFRVVVLVDNREIGEVAYSVIAPFGVGKPMVGGKQFVGSS